MSLYPLSFHDNFLGLGGFTGLGGYTYLGGSTGSTSFGGSLWFDSIILNEFIS